MTVLNGESLDTQSLKLVNVTNWQVTTFPFPIISLDSLKSVHQQGLANIEKENQYDDLLNGLLSDKGCTSTKIEVSQDGAYSTLYCSLPGLRDTVLSNVDTVNLAGGMVLDVEKILSLFCNNTLGEIVALSGNGLKCWFATLDRTSTSNTVNPTASA